MQVASFAPLDALTAAYPRAAEALPPDTQMVGFYSYGEISPVAPGECGDLHNQTMTVTTFWERD